MVYPAMKSTEVDFPDTPTRVSICEQLSQIISYWSGIGLSLDGLRLVGGLLRTMLLTRSSGYKVPRDRGLDVDLVTEDDAISVAIQLQAAYGGELSIHRRFGTANWYPPGHSNLTSIDFILARSERYSEPGQLPEVSPGNFTDDCFRRDFTVNTLSMDASSTENLHSSSHKVLLHHHPLALRDLETGIVRVLHAGSFQDDPTRLFRAVRYEQRLGFRMAEETLKLFQIGMTNSYLGTISVSRVRSEVEQVFMESHVDIILQRLDELGAMSAIGLGGHVAQEGYEACGNVSEIDHDRVEICWLLLLGTSQQNPEVAGKALGLRPKTLVLAGMFRELKSDASLKGDRYTDLELARRVGSVSPIVMRSLVAFFPQIGHRITRLLDRSCDPSPRLSGRDLAKLGIPPGPRMGRLLAELRVLRLAGYLQNAEEERRWLIDNH